MADPDNIERRVWHHRAQRTQGRRPGPLLQRADASKKRLVATVLAENTRMLQLARDSASQSPRARSAL
jgi:hypothetical protein